MSRATLLLLPVLLLACGAVQTEDDDGGEEADTGLATGGGEVGGGEDGGGEGSGGEGDEGGGEGGGDEGGGDEGGADEGGGDGGGGDEGGGDEGGDEGPPPLLPAAGAWSPAGFVVGSDPCNLTSFEDPASFIPSAFEIADVTTAGFTIGAPGEPATACSYAEPAFSCGVSSSEQPVGLGLDATLLLDNVFSGTVNTERDIDGRIDLEVTCDGSACGILELAGLAFPCALEGTFDMTH